VKRSVEVVVISDVHLGTYGCQAKELLSYLKSIKPEKLIINGDFIDIWQFSKKYFPNPHQKVIKYIFKLISKDVEVIYITGNHDETLRKFAPFEMSNFELCNKKILELDGKKHWFFHGDVFDASVHYAKWVAKLGGYGYDFLILMNAMSNWAMEKLGKPKYSFSKKIKNTVKGAIKFVNNFEQTAIDLALENEYDYVICGHIHQPQIRTYVAENGKIVNYMNSGDWVENCTALEYEKGQWTLHHFDNMQLKEDIPEDDEELSNHKIQEVIKDFFIKQ
jgi:UDP-2,3-diacylglucosamine pyrophosphatase LpxH